MQNFDKLFLNASEENFEKLIENAKERLIIITPALTNSISKLIETRINNLNDLDLRIILDSNSDVYRLGFGDQEALERIQKASQFNLFELRKQSGIRIGILVSDNSVLIYAPISQNIEVGSQENDKPNAILLNKFCADQISNSVKINGEIGNTGLTPNEITNILTDLNINPPKPFDLTRKLNVFTSKIQYVEFDAKNYQFSKKQISLPPEFLNIESEELKNITSAKVRLPFEKIDKVKITINHNNITEELFVDEKSINNERTRIEREYTFMIDNFGRVILSQNRKKFDNEVERFRLILTEYRLKIIEEIKNFKSEFENQFIKEYFLKWKSNPPEYFKRWNISATDEIIREEIIQSASNIFDKAIEFDLPKIKIVYKNISLENIEDREFMNSLKANMAIRKVPKYIIDSLFEMGDAAPELGSFIEK